MSASCRLLFPEDLVPALIQPRSVQVQEQWIPVNPEWWNNELTRRTLPGGPLQVTYNPEHGAGMSRGDLFELASENETKDGVLRLLWHALAWGGGRRARLMIKRLDSIAAEPDRFVMALRAAATAARTSPVTAYDTLYPSGRTLIRYLGPAFFTKFLYFAGGGVATHPCVILDRVVASSLRARGWDGLRSTGWSATTYTEYCELLACWAREAGRRLERVVAADEIERWLFGT